MIGGIADKLGNDYEALWALAEALRVLRGDAEEIRIEPFNEDAKGFEFRITSLGGDAWHQCKRKLVSGNWTIAALEREGILTNFARKLADPNATCVFVSSDPAPALRSLIDKANIVQSAADFTDALSEEDRVTLQNLRRFWNVTEDVEYDWLRRCRIETGSEHSTRRELAAVCNLLFQATPGDAIINLLDYLGNKITYTITTKSFREAIDSLDLGWKAGLDETLGSKAEAATRRYLASLPPKIGNRDIETPEVADAVDAVVNGNKKFLVVAGTAGVGKSAAMSRIVAAVEAAGKPVLAFRLDQFLGIQTMEELGRAILGRDESPVGAIGNRFYDKPAVVVIDQVDAVSESSGRSGLIRELLFQLTSDAEHFRWLQVVLACRSYDLANDSRLKTIAASERSTTVTLKPLDWERDVLPTLRAAGVQRKEFSEREQRNLSLPINLQLFLSIAASGESFAGEISGARLFDRLLDIRAAEFRRAGIEWTPAAALGLVAKSMSSNQELVAPESVLSGLSGSVQALASGGLIIETDGQVQFAHESFFDHSFSNHFLASGESLLALLKSDEQRLFRRTQVRQILARLREQGGNRRRYHQELHEVMNSDDVRYLVKDAVGMWLVNVDDPTDRERAIVAEWLPEEHPLSNIAKIVFNGRGWLPSLLDGGLIVQWLAGTTEAKALALWLLKKNAVTYAGRVSDLLRSWWTDSAERTEELLDWFAELYPEGDIGELEVLYRDIVATAPLSRLNEEKFSESFELGSWVHKDAALGARVLGMWLRRWLAAFPDSQPFERHIRGNDTYWLQELAKKVPEALLREVVPAFAESLRRDLACRKGGGSLVLHLPFRGQDGSFIKLLKNALCEVAPREPELVESLLGELPEEGQVATYLRLKVIAADPAYFWSTLPGLLTHPDLLGLGETGGDWIPFAEAAHAAMPHLPPPDRIAIETLVLQQRSEIEWAAEYLRRHEEFAAAGWGRDYKPYVMHQLSLSGTKERALLRTIGTEFLSAPAQARLEELERKFAGVPLPEAYGIRGGLVRSPIAGETAKKMSDAQWLKAMKRYADDSDRRHHAGDLFGGARQLSSVLQAETKASPARFVALLEQLPDGLNDAYAEAIVSGVREAETEPAIAARAIGAALERRLDDASRTMCWCVQNYPTVAKDQRILQFVLEVARNGSASDAMVTSSGPERPPKTTMRELLSGEENWEMSGINGQRGAAYEALASVLWEVPETYEVISDFVEQQLAAESLNSVRTCMSRTINSIAKYDAARAISLFKRLIASDLRLILGRGGTHFLNWAIYAYPDEFDDLIEAASDASSLPLQALGRVLESGLAIGDEGREVMFLAKFADDPLARQAAAYRASGNMTNDTVGDRAARWLEPLFNDPEKLVRDEGSHVNWEKLLADKSNRVGLVRAYIQSAAFDEHADRLMRALSERLDEFPELTFEALKRVLTLYDTWRAENRRRYLTVLHGLGRTIVRLYRAFEDDPEREREMLDLFDLYLARDLNDMRKEMEAYERD